MDMYIKHPVLRTDSQPTGLHVGSYTLICNILIFYAYEYATFSVRLWELWFSIQSEVIVSLKTLETVM